MERGEVLREEMGASEPVHPSSGARITLQPLEGDELAVSSAPPSPSPSTLCANCDNPLAGPYCSRCGQHVADYHRSVWRFVADFFDNTFCWDNKVLRTIGFLFRQPGFLTREFMAGRRVRYVHPLRLFLFTSAVCLALLHFGGDESGKKVSSTRSHRKADSAKGVSAKHPVKRDDQTPAETPDPDDDDDQPSSPSAAALPSPIPPEAKAALARIAAITSSGAIIPDIVSPAAPGSPTPAAIPSPGGKPKDEEGSAALNDVLARAIKDKVDPKDGEKIEDLGDRISQSLDTTIKTKGAARFSHELTEGIRQRLSWVALAMLPIFAFMLRSLYWQKDTFYFLHLVFSLHYHTFLLLAWTVCSWLGTLTQHSGFLHGLADLLLLGLPVYLFLALRQVYGGSVRRTWLKVLILGSMHFLAIVIGFAAVGGLSFLSAIQ